MKLLFFFFFSSVTERRHEGPYANRCFTACPSNCESGWRESVCIFLSLCKHTDSVGVLQNHPISAFLSAGVFVLSGSLIRSSNIFVAFIKSINPLWGVVGGGYEGCPLHNFNATQQSHFLLWVKFMRRGLASCFANLKFKWIHKSLLSVNRGALRIVVGIYAQKSSFTLWSLFMRDSRTLSSENVLWVFEYFPSDVHLSKSIYELCIMEVIFVARLSSLGKLKLTNVLIFSDTIRQMIHPSGRWARFLIWHH